MIFPRIRLTWLRTIIAAIITITLLVTLPRRSHTHTTTTTTTTSSSSSTLLADILKNYNPDAAARFIGAPPTTGGHPTLSPSVDVYTARLAGFISGIFPAAPLKEELDDMVSRLVHRQPLTPRPLPHNLISTDRGGDPAVHEYFRLWHTLLPLPLGDALARPLPNTQWAKPAREHTPWTNKTADDSIIAADVVAWVGNSTEWAHFWDTLQFGVLRADVYRYMALLFDGGVYVDSDTAPMAHPYLWGIDARSIVHPALDTLLGDTTSPATILNPAINLVVAVEFDSFIALNPLRWFLWSTARWRNSRQQDRAGRSLQFSQYAIMAKRYHPVMLDTLATVWENVKLGRVDGDNKLGAVDLTGPGPFTDAVLRYLLVRYGVTPAQLRDIGGPVRVGDVLILQEEAFLAPHVAMNRFIAYLRPYLPKLADAGHAIQTAASKPLWLWGGRGWYSWRSHGYRVIFHGLDGRWKGQGW